ncbi:MAG: hypothetical protein NT067_04095, partial [Candidatus Diapherotrites archaeon]|nr:hypothetical protein [Candidatus Diapherotrites archaeon]
VETIKAAESGAYPKSEIFTVSVKQAVIGTGPSAEPIASLEPGQELNPPWIIEVTGKAKDYTESEYPIYLDISGNIDNKKYVMTLVTALVKVSVTQCLQIEWIADNEYKSKDSSQGVISKDVTLTNNCGEALREIAISPETLGENELALYRPNALNRLEIGETATFQLKLTKRSDYFNKDHPDTIVAKGFLENTQEFIESNPLWIILEIGQTPETQNGPRFDAVQVPVCGAEDTEIKEINFPQTANKYECEHAYCDAVQFSEFLAEKLSDAVKKAQDKMQSKNFSADAFKCPALFCSFGTHLGIVSPTYTVYLRNDLVSAEIVKKGLEKEAPSLSSYAVTITSEDFGSMFEKATSFSPFNLYMSKALQGCGQYTFSIQGAVQNSSGALQKENLMLYVAVDDRKVTPECTNKIQNMMNFLPTDSGLSSSMALGTWAGMVQADKKLQDAGKDFAETLFGKGEGRVVLNTSSNKLLLLLKKLEGEGIMKLSIGQVSETDAKPNTVTLELDALFDSDDQTVRNEVAAKAKAGLDAMAQGSFALNACISENEDYLILYKFERLGELSIGDAKEMQLYYDVKNCLSLKVRAAIAGEKTTLKPKVMLKTNFNDPKTSANDKAGISEAWLELEGEGGATTIIEEYSDTEAGTMLELEPVKDKEGLNEKEFFLCAKGDDGQLFQAIGKKLKVKAKSVSLSDALAEGDVGVKETKGWYEVGLTACGLHPYEMLKKISEAKPEKGKAIEAYTILVWKGDPEELTLKSMIAAWRANKLKQQAGGADEEGKTMEQKLKSAKNFSIWMYFVSCGLANTACDMFLSWRIFFSPLDVLVNCGVPTIMGFFGTKIESGLGNVVESTQSFFHEPEVHEMTNAVQEVFTGTGDGGEATEAVEGYMLTGAIVGVSFRGALAAIPDGYRSPFTSLSSVAQTGINKTAEKIASDAATSWSNEFLKGANEATVKSLKDGLETDLKTRIVDKLTAAAKEQLGKGKRMFKIDGLNVKGASEASWGEASETLTKKIAANPAALKGSPIGDSLTNAMAKGADEVIDSGKVAQGTMDNLGVAKGTGGMYTNDATLAKDLTDKALKQMSYEDLAKANPKLNSMSSELKAQIEAGLSKHSGAISESNVKGVVDDAVRATKNQYLTEMQSAAKTNIDDQVKAFVQSQPSTRGTIPRGGRLKSFFTQLGTLDFWKKLGKSLTCGALANLAGLVTQQAVLNWKLGELRAVAEEGQGFNFTGPLSNYEGVEVFRKFKPYHITITMDDKGITHVSIE